MSADYAIRFINRSNGTFKLFHAASGNRPAHSRPPGELHPSTEGTLSWNLGQIPVVSSAGHVYWTIPGKDDAVVGILLQGYNEDGRPPYSAYTYACPNAGWVESNSGAPAYMIRPPVSGDQPYAFTVGGPRRGYRFTVTKDNAAKGIYNITATIEEDPRAR